MVVLLAFPTGTVRSLQSLTDLTVCDSSRSEKLAFPLGKMKINKAEKSYSRGRAKRAMSLSWKISFSHFSLTVLNNMMYLSMYKNMHSAPTAGALCMFRPC